MLTSKHKAASENGLATNALKTSIIGQGITIQGEINTNADIRIDGKVIGNINSTAKVVVGESGYIEGDISAIQCDITGKVKGNFFIKELLSLRGKAEIEGDVKAGKISLEPTVMFNGSCRMGQTSSTLLESSEKNNQPLTVVLENVPAAQNI